MRKELNQHLKKNEQIIDTIGEQVNDLQAVRSFMLRRIEEHQLTPVQQQKMGMYEFIYNQLMGRKFTEIELLDLIMSKYECKRTLAVHLINDTKELFTTVLSINKQWELKQQLEANKKMMRKAELAGDNKGYAMLEKNYYKMLELVEEAEVINDDFVGHTIQITADPSIIGVKPADKNEVRELLVELKEKFNFQDAIILDDDPKEGGRE